MQSLYIKYSFRILYNKFYEEYAYLFDNYRLIRTLFLVLSIIILCLLYFILWIPYLNRLSKEVKKNINTLYLNANKNYFFFRYGAINVY